MFQEMIYKMYAEDNAIEKNIRQMLEHEGFDIYELSKDMKHAAQVIGFEGYRFEIKDGSVGSTNTRIYNLIKGNTLVSTFMVVNTYVNTSSHPNETRIDAMTIVGTVGFMFEDKL